MSERKKAFTWEPGDVDVIDDDESTQVIKGNFAISQTDEDKRLAFGWANIAINAGGVVIEDKQHDIIEPAVLEIAAYNFVEFYREGGEMHKRGDCAVLIESMVFTDEKVAALGIPSSIIPECGWWIGFKVTDDDVWEKVKSGQYGMFSIEGQAIRREVDM